MSGGGDELAPLRGLLDSVLNRLCAVEDKVGIQGGKAGAGRAAPASAEEESGGPHPALVAYDEHVSRTVRPFAESCDAVGLGPSVGPNVLAAWGGIRTVVELGTKCKRPSGDPAACAEALAPYLEPVRESVTKIRTARLDRRFDRHVKAIVEMLAIASWPVVSPPSQPTPTAFVKESIGSSDFWSNKIRKEYKNRDDDASRAHIQFCDDMKRLILDLAGYTKEHHLSGLMWNPRGADVSEASVGGSAPAPAPAAPAAAMKKESGGGTGDIVAELNKKKNADGTSAAAGLKRVTRDQQTWRKEFDRDAAGAVPSASAAKAPQRSAAAAAPPKRGPPVLEYRDRGHKWAVENHAASTAEGGVLDVNVTDPKQQVYIYRCESVTVRINGPKVKNIIMDECNKVSCVFDTAISACEIVNCNKVQVQATGSCPSFSIDKTDGCLVYLSGEAVETTGFVTSKSSEMNVSWEDEGGEVKEAPIPEQFQHRLVNGVIKSDVSDLYH